MTQCVPPKNSPNHLLVEGRDDVMAVGALLKSFGITWPAKPWHPFAHDCGGVEELLRAIPVALKASYRRLGIVVDADISVEDRWTQLRTRFDSEGIAFPVSPDADGTVISLNEPARPERIGVWLMTNNASPGMLEDFLSSLVPPNDAIYELATTSTDAALNAGAPLNRAHRVKGCIHTYLAWQDPSGMPFGTAITAHVLEHDRAIAERFMSWLQRLFA